MESNLGLTSEQALEYLEKDGPNQVGESLKSSTLHLLFRQFTNPAIVVLLITALIYGALGNEHDSLILIAIVIPSGLLTFIQEYQSQKIMDRLRQQLSLNARVIRDGIEIEIPVEGVVKGDVVALKPGELVPADALVLDDASFSVDESILTGESLPRRRSANARDELFMGTHIVGGVGRARVIRTGAESKYGEMAHRIALQDVDTSFEKGIRAFGFMVARYVFVLIIVIFLGNLVLKRPLFESLLFSLALAVGLTPQMLPVIISICLATGARRLSQEGVLVKRLDAIEDLGTMECLVTDKTGTLTLGELSLISANDVEGISSERIEQLGYENAALQTSSANAIDAALLRSVKSRPTRKKIGEIPFTFERRRVSVITSDGELICKGAFTEILSLSSRVRVKQSVQPIEGFRERLEEQNRDAGESGLKVIAVATKPGVTEISIGVESELIFEGLLLISDPPKEGARESLARLRDLGIELYLLTGDNAVTAAAIARQVEIPCTKVVRGKEVEKVSDHLLSDLLAQSKVIAEVDPLQKIRIVNVLKGNGQTVGFLGDGINDAAALRASDVAISVDEAVDVAKSASSIVLLEKDLSVIADGVVIGRRTFINTLKYIRISISALFGNVVSVALASYFLPYLPMLPTQILILNFFNDLPAIAIASDRVDAEELASPKEWTHRRIGHFMVFFGFISTAFDLMVFISCQLIFHASKEELRSTWFAESAITAVIAILVLRSPRAFWKSKPSNALLAISSLVIAVALMVPSLGLFGLFGLPKIDLKFTYLATGLALGYVVANEIAKRRVRLM